MTLPTWLAASRDGGSVLTLHVQPGAKRSEVVGPHGDALKLRLATPPVEGRANAALLAFLAAQLGLPRSALSLLSGDTSRHKRVAIPLPPNAVAERLGDVASSV